ncbi:MAG: hypothetical protein MI824_09945, partial [Hyphomicrobiales bacterium]|nr:hypothetical protein [Hyphomicrobiales bacterium]
DRERPATATFPVIPAKAQWCPEFERRPYPTVVIAGLDPAIHAICLSISLRGQWNGCPDQVRA